MMCRPPQVSVKKAMTVLVLWYCTVVVLLWRMRSVELSNRCIKAEALSSAIRTC